MREYILKTAEKYGILIFVLLSQLTGFVYMVNYPRRLTLAAVLISIISVGGSIYMFKNKSYWQGALAAVFFLAFIIRADYIIYTPTWIRQHDVIGFGASEGQAGYIEYFYNKFQLIDFDPRKRWGFFQPPLHHMLAALWLHLQVFIGKAFAFSYDHACENVQILTMIYSGITVYFSYKIYRFLGFDKLSLLSAAAFVALHPSFIFMSGSINNDMLCIMLQVICIYFFFLWLKSQSYKDIFFAALFMGLSMMAKLQAVLLVPAIGILLLVRLVQSIKKSDDTLTLIKQYVMFGLVSVPIGIWSPVRNLVKFNVPLNFTPKVNEPVGDMSLFDRVFKWGKDITPFTCLEANGNSYDEFNIPLTLLKTSLFGESDFSMTSGLAEIIGWCLLILGIGIVLMCIALMIWSFGSRENREVIAFLNIYIITSFLFIINLCVTIPNFSSQDFRYIAHVLVAFGALLGFYLKNGINKYLKCAAVFLTYIFLLCSYAMYLCAGLIIWN